MTTAELMAIEVLKGNMVAARALADMLCEEVQHTPILPSKIVKCAFDKIRAAAYFPAKVSYEVDVPATVQAIEGWLEHGTVITVVGCERIELFEMP